MTSLEPNTLIGRTAVDSDGTKVGKIGQVYLDPQTDQPVWVTVSTGMFGTKQSFAPLAGASDDGDDVRLTVTKDQIKDAPNVEDDGQTSDEEERALYSHYSNVMGQGAGADANADRPVGGPGYDTSGPTTDEAMTRSEER